MGADQRITVSAKLIEWSIRMAIPSQDATVMYDILKILAGSVVAGFVTWKVATRQGKVSEEVSEMQAATSLSSATFQAQNTLTTNLLARVASLEVQQNDQQKQLHAAYTEIQELKTNLARSVRKNEELEHENNIRRAEFEKTVNQLHAENSMLRGQMRAMEESYTAQIHTLEGRCNALSAECEALRQIATPQIDLPSSLPYINSPE